MMTGLRLIIVMWECEEWQIMKSCIHQIIGATGGEWHINYVFQSPLFLSLHSTLSFIMTLNLQ